MMKNRLYSLLKLSAVLAVIICLQSCDKEDNTLEISTLPPLPENSIYYINLGDQEINPVVVSLDAIKTNKKPAHTQRNPNPHANGTFVLTGPTSGIDFDVEFSAMQNNGGIHGTGSFSDFFGPGADLITATNCLVIEGTHAVVGGEITDVTDPDFSFFIGGYFYFHVVDNGEGNNAPEDQWYRTIFLSPVPIPCEEICPSCFDWELADPAIIDITAGNIQVN